MTPVAIRAMRGEDAKQVLAIYQAGLDGGLRLEERTQKHAVVDSGADATKVPLVQRVAHPLGLKDLGFSLTAALA